MAHGKLTIVNPSTEEIKVLPVGFSWTVLFWGCFPALFRQDWKNLGIMAGVLIIAAFAMIAFIPNIIFSFIYNDKMCLKDHLNKGWKVKEYVGKKNLDSVSSSVGINLSKNMLS